MTGSFVISGYEQDSLLSLLTAAILDLRFRKLDSLTAGVRANLPPTKVDTEEGDEHNSHQTEYKNKGQVGSTVLVETYSKPLHRISQENTTEREKAASSAESTINV